MADLFAKITAESAGASPFEFSAITEEAGNTFAPSDEQAQAGTYSYKAAFGGTAGSNACYGNIIFAESKTVYFKAYFRFNATLDVGVNIASCTDGANGVFYIRGAISGGNLSFDRFYRYTDAGSAYTAVASGTISRDAWHYIEVWYKAATSDGANDGEAWLALDGVELANVGSLDSDTILPDRISFGNTGSNVPANGSAIYFDEIEGMDTEPGGAVANSHYYRMNQ